LFYIGQCPDGVISSNSVPPLDWSLSMLLPPPVCVVARRTVERRDAVIPDNAVFYALTPGATPLHGVLCQRLVRARGVHITQK
jgi:hypothetical protein